LRSENKGSIAYIKAGGSELTDKIHYLESNFVEIYTFQKF